MQESECEDLGPPKSRDSLPKDCIEDRVHANRGYKVISLSKNLCEKDVIRNKGIMGQKEVLARVCCPL